MGDRHLVVVEPEDTVATAIRELEAGETVTVTVGSAKQTIEIAEDVPFGHKIALTTIDAGEPVYKYGHSIGDASESIEPGEWVHVHNVESNYGRGDEAETAEAAGE